MANIAPKSVLAVSLAASPNTDTNFTVTRPLTVIDVAMLTTVTQNGGAQTATLKNTASAVSSAIATVTAGDLVRTASLDLTKRVFVANDVMRVTVDSGAAGACTAIVSVIPTAITGGT